MHAWDKGKAQWCAFNFDSQLVWYGTQALHRIFYAPDFSGHRLDKHAHVEKFAVTESKLIAVMKVVIYCGKNDKPRITGKLCVYGDYQLDDITGGCWNVLGEYETDDESVRGLCGSSAWVAVVYDARIVIFNAYDATVNTIQLSIPTTQHCATCFDLEHPMIFDDILVFASKRIRSDPTEIHTECFNLRTRERVFAIGSDKPHMCILVNRDNALSFSTLRCALTY